MCEMISLVHDEGNNVVRIARVGPVEWTLELMS